MELKEKENQDENHTKNWLKEPKDSRYLLTLNLTLSQRKTFSRQKVPEPSFAKKETADKNILKTSRNIEKNLATY